MEYRIGCVQKSESKREREEGGERDEGRKREGEHRTMKKWKQK